MQMMAGEYTHTHPDIKAYRLNQPVGCENQVSISKGFGMSVSKIKIGTRATLSLSNGANTGTITISSKQYLVFILF